MTLKQAKLNAIEKYLELDKDYMWYLNLLLYTSDQTNHQGDIKRRNELSDKLAALRVFYYDTFKHHIQDDIKHYKKMGDIKDDR